jgi:hypothetical protein
MGIAGELLILVAPTVPLFQGGTKGGIGAREAKDRLLEWINRYIYTVV